MKKQFKRALATLTASMIIFTMIPGYMVNAASSLSNEIRVYNYLVDKMGLNTAAACGLLANVKAESNFNPLGDGDAGTSFGLFQWHAGRKANLISYCESNGLDYMSIEGQMKYLEYELKKSYSSVYDFIKNVENTADGAYQAGYHWCYYYEIPANREVKADRRGETARSVYWKKYEIFGGKTVKEEYDMEPADYRVSYSRAMKVEDDYIIGSDVLYMQLCLYCLGYNLEADGCYGPMTSGVVKRFQSEHGLTADGICGKQTWNAIEKELYEGNLRITRQPQSVTAEIGEKVNFSVRAAGSEPRYQWYHKKVGADGWTLWEGQTAASILVKSNESWNGMQVRCTVTDSSGNTVNSKAVTVTINIPIEITKHPQSVSTAAGEIVTFTVEAKGNELSYQWYFMKAGTSEWKLWSDHTEASMTALANSTWNGMQVRCTVTDSKGNKRDSEPATVTLSIPFEITQQPQSVTANVGDTVNFTVQSSGSELSYQWYFRKAGSSWTKWEGKTSASISGKADLGWNGMQVMCIVSDSSGNMETSASATVTINIPLAITQQPRSVTAEDGEIVEFSVVATGSGLSYQWYYKKVGASWTKWSGHTTAATEAMANVSWDGMQVMCLVSDSSGNIVNSETATVTIDVPLDITQHPQSVTVSAGEIAAFSVTATGKDLRYQWYFRKTGASEWTKWEGHTTSTTSAMANESWNGMQVRCTVTDSKGSTAESKAATVTIDIPLEITQHPKSVAASVGDTVNFTVKAKGNGLNYQWYYRKSGDSSWTKWAGHTTATTSGTADASWNGMKVMCAVTDINGSKLNSGSATVTINVPLEITQHPQSVKAKAGDTVTFTVKATGVGLRYQWYFRKTGAADWTKWAGHTTATTSATANDSWNGMQVRCTVTDSSGSTADSKAATVTMDIPLAITQHPQSVKANSGDTVTFTVKASGSGLRYQWYFRKSGAADWTKWAGHTTAATSTTANESWNGMQVRCTVTDSSGNSRNSEAATVTIESVFAITQHPQSVIAGVGDTVTFTVKASGSGLRYQWYYRKVGSLNWVRWEGHTTATTSATTNESWNGMRVMCIVTDDSGSRLNTYSAEVTLIVG